MPVKDDWANGQTVNASDLNEVAVAVNTLEESAVTQSDIDTAVTNLKGTAGAALDTLGELSDALGDDANYAATVTTALAGKVPTTRQVNGHALSADVTVTKSDVGLGNVDNTADTAKPVSTAQQTALDLKAPLASPTFTGTVSGVTKAHVGLGNVDNTADASKPVSTAQQTALNKKVEVVTYTGSLGTTRPTADAVYWVDYPSTPTNAQPQDIIASTTTTVLDTGFTLQDAADTSKQVRFDVNSAQIASTTRTFVLPAVTDQLATLNAAETFTSKTLNGCTINAPSGLAKADVGLSNVSNVTQMPLDATINAQTGTTYTLVAGDDGKVITHSNASASTITFPQNSAAAIPVGASGEIHVIGAGQVTFAAGTGATVTSRGSVLKSAGQYAVIGWRKLSTNGFNLTGDLTA